jgi:hypothetical protein
VIFVDDLERCRPPSSVEVCEVAARLLNHPGVITVLIADMNAVAAAAASKYADLASRYAADGSQPSQDADAQTAFGRTYLEKLVQLQFDLPTASREALREVVAE